MTDENNPADSESGSSAEEKKTSQSWIIAATTILSLPIYWVFALYYIWNSTGRSTAWPLLAGSAWGIFLFGAATKKDAGVGVTLCCILLILSGLAATLLLGFLVSFASGFVH